MHTHPPAPHPREKRMGDASDSHECMNTVERQQDVVFATDRRMSRVAARLDLLGLVACSSVSTDTRRRAVPSNSLRSGCTFLEARIAGMAFSTCWGQPALRRGTAHEDAGSDWDLLSVVEKSSLSQPQRAGRVRTRFDKNSLEASAAAQRRHHTHQAHCTSQWD